MPVSAWLPTRRWSPIVFYYPKPGGHERAPRGAPPPRPSPARPHDCRPRDSRALTPAACAPQVIQDIMLGGPENVSAYCTGDLDELAATAAELNMSTPTSQETLHGDQMGAFAHSVRRAACSARAAASVHVPACLPSAVVGARQAASRASKGLGLLGHSSRVLPGVRAAWGIRTLTQQGNARRTDSAELGAPVPAGVLPHDRRRLADEPPAAGGAARRLHPGMRRRPRVQVLWGVRTLFSCTQMRSCRSAHRCLVALDACGGRTCKSALFLCRLQ
jgi:hypothetical protein